MPKATAKTKRIIGDYFFRAFNKDAEVLQHSDLIGHDEYGWRSRRAVQVAGVRAGLTGYAVVNAYLDEAVEDGSLERRENPRNGSVEYRFSG